MSSSQNKLCIICFLHEERTFGGGIIGGGSGEIESSLGGIVGTCTVCVGEEEISSRASSEE